MCNGKNCSIIQTYFIIRGDIQLNSTDLFLDKYRQLEDAVRTVYDLDDRDSVSHYLSSSSKFYRYREDIRYCQDVRNLLSHKRKINGSYAVEPSQAMLDFISALIKKVRNRPMCCDIQIGFGDVFWQPLDGNVKQTIRVMRQKQYTQVPVLKNGRVVGVFDENSVFSYLARSEESVVSDTLEFRDICEFISLDERENTQFVFFKNKSYVDELEDEIEAAFRQGKRIGMAFITANGRHDEKLLGIITPWDIIAVED